MDWWLRNRSRALRMLLAVALLNLATWLASVPALGGTALYGKIEGNQHYVRLAPGRGGHHVYSAVPRAVFWINFWHSMSQPLTLPLGIWAGIRLYDDRS